MNSSRCSHTLRKNQVKNWIGSWRWLTGTFPSLSSLLPATFLHYFARPRKRLPTASWRPSLLLVVSPPWVHSLPGVSALHHRSVPLSWTTNAAAAQSFQFSASILSPPHCPWPFWPWRPPVPVSHTPFVVVFGSLYHKLISEASKVEIRNLAFLPHSCTI